MNEGTGCPTLQKLECRRRGPRHPGCDKVEFSHYEHAITLIWHDGETYYKLQLRCRYSSDSKFYGDNDKPALVRDGTTISVETTLYVWSPTNGWLNFCTWHHSEPTSVKKPSYKALYEAALPALSGPRSGSQRAVFSWFENMFPYDTFQMQMRHAKDCDLNWDIKYIRNG